ncbi:MAG: SDR family oxidoreductase [Burkholderiaceae bacterium]|nr:SDR family oxidoreductase [Burkholderiaceae bacterium]
MKISDTRVLLTGASGGIGQTMAAALQQAGAQVLGVSRSPHQDATGLRWVQADLSHAEGVARVAQAARAWDANVVVHAAGLPGFGALPQLAPAQMQAVLHANLLAPMLLTQALLPQLLRQPKAQIVFVGSALGRIGLPGFSLYSASKAGLHGFAEALRRELADSPVRVQLLAPRSTRTSFNDATAQAYNQATGTASDSAERVAQALLGLIESEAAERYIGWPERLGVRLGGAFPPLLDGSFKKHRRQLAASTPTEGVTP